MIHVLILLFCEVGKGHEIERAVSKTSKEASPNPIMGLQRVWTRPSFAYSVTLERVAICTLR